MTTKCFCVVRSSNQGEIGLLSQIRPIESPVAYFEMKQLALAPVAKPVNDSKPRVVQIKEQPQGSIWTLGSPERKTSDVGSALGLGEFLKACFLCKKKLHQENDIFMYGYLGAFCSLECREDQIDLDGLDREIPLDYSTRLKMAGNRKGMQWQRFGN